MDRPFRQGNVHSTRSNLLDNGTADHAAHAIDNNNTSTAASAITWLPWGAFNAKAKSETMAISRVMRRHVPEEQNWWQKRWQKWWHDECGGEIKLVARVVAPLVWMQNWWQKRWQKWWHDESGGAIKMVARVVASLVWV